MDDANRPDLVVILIHTSDEVAGAVPRRFADGSARDLAHPGPGKPRPMEHYLVLIQPMMALWRVNIPAGSRSAGCSLSVPDLHAATLCKPVLGGPGMGHSILDSP